ncbi:bacteriohopanetetrol glucosamine biosynthesis glycosyltransferase HpnI [Zymomonas mobilis]|uniref:Hopanoid biosynthesis associated glycosyl transferase protein HpnI n=1 Tax=Zymomonas mobilis subsp. pomaceae (strain ATCC 29192 / DSM 22645 / JCM 10191 / CCUG 17912 / NBRC 13757 / NCIMB 11200 / NRRL B-4491 / Barker I) TaxID=579138 RepID=F8EUJ1_ZYMMT|nr:bacteriohopanetetrol glucosamine biosynthesis glycosyltransferase HpnI [Zymomonas mobilis]AEI37207.1 hopanoid biosynthesis associated glycosyl transferase protein HpnI [Zymomonas mobilis subsp. pomaceae ATCC 29192]MDX5948577.1 bacteriohopanetetrol glucosamine biosynthesis glycosyltransferase HpnI [Zymomonas mobilis subsp. pomaceae]
MITILHVLLMLIGSIALLMALIGVGYTILAAIVVLYWQKKETVSLRNWPSVSLIKPLHGDEPALAENLQTFLDQDYPADYEMLCGIQHPADPAGETVRLIAAQNSKAPVRLIVDNKTHGTNAKISNLINITAHIGHDIMIISDSDMSVSDYYISQVVNALEKPGVGAVTCLYHGRGDNGYWSRLSAANIDYNFLPSVMVGVALTKANPCMGSTIAIKRDTLESIGGLESLSNILADDYMLGAKVRALGLKVEVLPVILTHSCTESSFLSLVRHELRWSATIRDIDPVGFLGSAVTYPVPLAFIGLIATSGWVSWPVFCLALASRWLLGWRINKVTGVSRLEALLQLPLRDLLSFGIFLSTFFISSVDWQGMELMLHSNGRISRK